MKKKILSLVLWVAFTALYVFNMIDTGRAMGGKTNDAIEDYVEYYTDEYIGVDGMAKGATNAWSYSYFDDLSERFKTDYAGIAVATVIYLVVTICCYHFAFIHKSKEEKEG